MKKIVIAAALSFAALAFAKPMKAKGNFTLGVTPVSEKYTDAPTDTETDFDSGYFLADVSVENEYVTAAGKMYYRITKSDDSNDLDKDKKLAQKLDLKRAYVRVRPFGNNLLEASIGKLYSYYLPGNFFQLGEIYTGASRWGKTGVGLKSEVAGFTFGVGLPLTESYLEFDNSFGIAGAVCYDFKSLSENVPLKIGATLSYAHEFKETQNSKTKKITETNTNEFASTFSVNFAPKTNGFISHVNTTLSASFNAEPYVSSSVFKNVTNYDNTTMKLSHFVSYNLRTDFGPVQVTLEGEAGHSVKGSMIPLYTGLQTLIPIVDHLAFKPQIFYYAGIDEDNSDNSRQTFEFYPRLWVTFTHWVVSAGCNFDYKQTTKDDYVWEWKIPMYVEYKL